MNDNERNHIKTFDCHGDQNTLGLRWKRWLTAFELFADGKGLILNEDNANNISWDPMFKQGRDGGKLVAGRETKFRASVPLR